MANFRSLKNSDSKFDIDLRYGVDREDAFVNVLRGSKIEHKSDKQCERTGNIFVEFESRGKLSGITTTEADFWAIEYTDTSWVLVKTKVVENLYKRAISEGRVASGGDDYTSRGALIPIEWFVGKFSTFPGGMEAQTKRGNVLSRGDERSEATRSPCIGADNLPIPYTPEYKTFEVLAQWMNLARAKDKATNPKVKEAIESKLSRIFRENMANIIEGMSLFGFHPVAIIDGKECWLATPQTVEDIRSTGEIAYTWEEFKEAKDHDEFKYAQIIFKGEEVPVIDFDLLKPTSVNSFPAPYILRKIDRKSALRMSELKRGILSCNSCELAKTRKNVVPGEGYLAPYILFVGEGPGENEDNTGIPFVGRSGDLLNDLLEGAGIKREQIFITNVVKCRPPGNRAPAPIEVRSCRSFLEQQIECLNPSIIVPLGGPALKWFIPSITISEGRGKTFPWNRRIVIPTFHPAAVLRTRKLLPTVQEDFQLIAKTQNEILRGGIDSVAR